MTISTRRPGISVESSSSTRSTRNLTMVAGSFYQPKLRNASRPMGDDAHFIDSVAQVVGVADGVGGCHKRGIDSGKYARSLMKNASLCESVLDATSVGSAVNPKEVLCEAFLTTVEKGSSTCCIVALDRDVLRAANLGDSGFAVIRDGKVIYKSPAQQHRFNCPYQFGRGKTFRNVPEDADEIEFAVEDGDVLVVATDGLFDNAFDADIEKIVVRGLAEGKSPGELARMLVDMAVDNSLNMVKASPFQLAMHEAGYKEFVGGKTDDVTVIAAYVSEATPNPDILRFFCLWWFMSKSVRFLVELFCGVNLSPE